MIPPYMNIQPTPQKLLDKPTMYGNQNSLRPLSRSATWYSCREQFHAHVGTGRSRPKGFYYGADDPYGLAAIIDWVEFVLNLKPEQKIKISLCQAKPKEPLQRPKAGSDKKLNVVHLQLSDFWVSQKIRFYFLTILCRAHRATAVWHHPLDAILDVHYFNGTRHATGMFLNGYTEATGILANQDSNWCQLFSTSTTVTQNLNYLARPSTEKELRQFNDGIVVPNLTASDKWRITEWIAKGDPKFAATLFT